MSELFTLRKKKKSMHKPLHSKEVVGRRGYISIGDFFQIATNRIGQIRNAMRILLKMRKTMRNKNKIKSEEWQ